VTQLNLKLWGVMGSTPGATSPTLLKYGTNTSCVSVEYEDELVIFDAGTGIVQLASYLNAKELPKHIHLFISHYHYDHIQGLPFFNLVFNPQVNMTIYGMRHKLLSVKDVLDRFFLDPFSPIGLKYMQASIQFVTIDSEEEFIINDRLRVNSYFVTHPYGSMVYRIDSTNGSICYISDFEYNEIDHANLTLFCQRSDAIIYDSFFSENELHSSKYRGWGHSSAAMGALLAKESCSKKLFLFHHSINRSEEGFKELITEARSIFPNTELAREGTSLTV